MKELFKNGVIILLIIGLLYIIFLRECKHPEPKPCPEVGKVLINQFTWDSILALANKPPIVKYDTIYGDTVYLPSPSIPEPKPDPVDTTINAYHDNIKNKQINAWYDFKVKDNRLIWSRWGYVPITIRRDSIVFVPKIVDNPVEVPISKSGLYLSANVGGNTSNFLYGGGIDYINKKDNLYGYTYQRYGNLNFHSIKIGGKIKFKR
jgi:hypothetical protein